MQSFLRPTPSGIDNMQLYDSHDFERNPDKYALFRSARLCTPLTSSPDVQVGECLAISLFDVRPNPPMGAAAMPLYMATRSNGDIHYLFACALADFTL